MAIATMEWMKILIMIITVSSGVAAPIHIHMEEEY